MPNEKPTIQLGSSLYRIVDGDEEGDPVDYGQTATLDTEDGRRLIAIVDFDIEDHDPVTLLPGGVWMRDLATDEAIECERLEVAFEGDDDDEDGEEEDEEEDEDGEGDGDDDGSDGEPMIIDYP